MAQNSSSVENDTKNAPANNPVDRADVQRHADVQNGAHVANEVNAARTATGITPESVSTQQFVGRFNQIVDRNTGAVNTDLDGALSQGKLYQVNDAGVNLSRAGTDVPPPPNGRTGAGTDGTMIARDQGKDAGDNGAGNQHADAATEQQQLMQHVNDKNNGMDAQQQKLVTDSINQIMNNDKLTADQKAEILHQANRMFDEQDRVYAQGFSQKDRNELVTGLMYDTAHPEAENQGQHNTCNGTTIGKVETMEDPAKNAQRVVDMYTNANGDHTVDVNGHKVQYDVNSLRSTQESDYAQTQAGLNGGARDLFVQAMNHMYINDMTQRQGLYYTQERSGVYGQSDTGERLHAGGFDGQTIGADGRVGGVPPASSPQINGDQMAQELKNLGVQSGLLANNNHFGITDANAKNVTTTDALNSAWDANGGKPMIAAVDTRAGIFQPNGEVGGAGGGHVVVVDGRQQVGTDANGKPVYEYHIANSWGQQYNGWVTQNDLVNAMDPTSRTAQNDGRGLQPTPQPGTAGGGDAPSSSTLPRPAQGGNAPEGYANYDSNQSGVRRSPDGIVPNTNPNSMTSDQIQAWFKHYQEQLQQQKDDEERQASLKRLRDQAQAANGSDQGGGG